MDGPATHHARMSGLAAVLLTLVGWSSIPLFLEHFTTSIDAWTSNGWRYATAALIWAPIVILGALRRTLPPHIWRAAIVPSLFNCAGQVAFTTAHYELFPGLVTFGLRMQIVFVAIGAMLLFPPERRLIRSPTFLAGLLVVFLGTMGTVLLGGLTSDAPPSADGTAEAAASEAWSVGGILLALGAGLMFACYGLAVKWCMRGIAPLKAFAAISQYTAAGMVLLMIVFGRRSGLEALDMPVDQFGLLLVSAVIGIALGHVCYYISIDRLGVAVSSGVIQLQPFLVAAASVVLFHEPLTALQWLSGGLAVLGAGVILVVQHRMSARDRAMHRPPAEALEDLPADHVAAAAEAAEAQPVQAADRPR